MSSLTPCNFCSLRSIKARYRPEEILCLTVHGWITYYQVDADPLPGQGEPLEHNGRPIRFLASFMSLTGHCVC